MSHLNQLTRIAWLSGAASALLSLGGCGTALQGIESQNEFMVAAPSLCEDTPGYTLAADGKTCQLGTAVGAAEPAATTPNFAKEYLGLIINESQYNCGKFLNGLVLAANSSNLGLDALSTVFGALGTAFTPLATVHALSAAGTISSGWRANIDSDIYAKAAIAAYSQAIQSTYYTDLQTYMNQLATENADDIIVSLEIAKIRTIHKECGLASAQAAISATLQPGPSGAAAVNPQIVTVTAAAAKNDTFTLTGSGGALKTPVAITYTAATAETADAIAAKLAGSINGNAALRDAGVTATPGATGSASFTVNSPAGISWTVTGNVKIASPAKPAAPAAPAAAAAAGGPVPLTGALLVAPTLTPTQRSTGGGTATQSVVPGHAVR
ncbi:MAG: hypothetical protein ABSC95_03095 [Acetobacteraceae bacterium]|jgi:hypothetical protein